MKTEYQYQIGEYNQNLVRIRKRPNRTERSFLRLGLSNDFVEIEIDKLPEIEKAIKETR